MSIRKHIEHADDALRCAIIECLEKKQDEQLDLLFDALHHVRKLMLTTPIVPEELIRDEWNKEYSFNLSSDYLDSNVINFPDGTVAGTHVRGGEGEDHINLGGGYKLNEDVISFGGKKHGKDLDKLDDWK
jgi:hypothetical protein